MSVIRPDRNGVFPRLDLPFYGPIALGNGTKFHFGILRCGDVGRRLFVGIEGHGAYTFGSFVHSGYAEEKLGLLPDDAGNVADLINGQLGLRDVPTQGLYDDDLCAEGVTS